MEFLESALKEFIGVYIELTVLLAVFVFGLIIFVPLFI
jgi:hypothetical protein